MDKKGGGYRKINTIFNFGDPIFLTNGIFIVIVGRWERFWEMLEYSRLRF